MLDICHPLRYNGKAVKQNAAIAQSVERILGKDEVASSNLASSSIKQTPARLSGCFVLFRCSRFELAKPVKIWPKPPCAAGGG